MNFIFQNPQLKMNDRLWLPYTFLSPNSGAGLPPLRGSCHETLLFYIYFMNTQIRKSFTELNKIYF